MNVVVVGVCAGLAGRAAGHLVEGSVGDASSGLPARHRPPPAEPPPHSKDGDQIVARNVFCSGCTPVQRSEKRVDPDTPRPTTLALELISTMIVRSDERYSMAVIRDLSTKQKDPGLFNKGAVIGATGAEVLEVRPKRVLLRNGDRVEYLALDVDVAPGSPPAASTPGVAPPSGVDAAAGDLDRGVRCAGHACTVDRALVERLLANTAALASAARVFPSVKDGRPNGFKLSAIRANGIFDKLQFQNDDTIKRINGNDMSSIDAALALFTKLRSASHLSVQVERRGETVTLDYTIR
jgi:general secretion pathway protein C